MRNACETLNFESVCRFCLESGCRDSIFDHDTIDIPDVVMFLTQLEISTADAHTKLICVSCKEFIESIVKFRERCIRSYNTLETQQLIDKENLRYETESDESLVDKDFRLEFIKCDSPQTEGSPGCEDEDDVVADLKNDIQSDSDFHATDDHHDNRRVQIASNIVACPLCGERIAGGKMMLNHHIKSDHADDDGLPKIRQCFFCPKAYSSYQLLKYHLNFHPRDIWECPQCDKQIEKKGVFIDHLRMHANERHYECSVCGKRFTTIKYLSTHRQIHKLQQQTPEKAKNTSQNDAFSGDFNDPKQSECPKQITDESQFYQCTICPAVFHEHALLQVHLQCDHVPEDKSIEHNFMCAVCSKVYVSLYHLNTHMRLHELDEPGRSADELSPKKELDRKRDVPKKRGSDRCFLCVYCGRNFPTSRYLNRHLQSHKKESSKKKPEMFECEICGKQMKYKSNYTNHVKSHKNNTKQATARQHGEAGSGAVVAKRMYLCNICGQNCGSSSNLLVHLRRHNGQSVCHCSICDKGFPRKSDLVLHMRKHTGEKPYECSSCGKRFSRRDKLRIHIRTHTGEKPYECPCGRAFAQRNDLKTHQKRNNCGQNFDLSKLLAPYPTTICINPLTALN